MSARPDWGYRLISLVAAVVAGWMLLTPWIPFVSDCLMRRFHLRTSSFAVWSVQQIVPPMYSFRNTAVVRDLPLDIVESGLIDPFLLDPLLFNPLNEPPNVAAVKNELGVVAQRTINHFPAREITFANTRYRYFSEPENPSQADRWIVLESTYRGRSLRSVYELHLQDRRFWKMTLAEDAER